MTGVKIEVEQGCPDPVEAFAVLFRTTMQLYLEICRSEDLRARLQKAIEQTFDPPQGPDEELMNDVLSVLLNDLKS